MSHLPVLYHEILYMLQPYSGGYYVDGTIGAGGHAKGILEASEPDGKLLGLDLDPNALNLAHQQLKEFGDRVILKQASYTSLRDQLNEIGWSCVDGILLDLGVSSMQMDTPDRGFSFRKDASLDMRFDPKGLVTAADLVNGLPESELADIIHRYGEERRSRQIAKAIVKQRPIHTTFELAGVIIGVIGTRPGKVHPATKTFQALRIATNDELKSVQSALPDAVSLLKSGGRLAVISFHSLEDRIVKNYFRKESQDCHCPPKQPVCTCNHKAILQEVSRRPIRPENLEIQTNPRSRSARLRIAEKI
jgi:16S rRNA (cytosine1402-N4)-methyltransferase